MRLELFDFEAEDFRLEHLLDSDENLKLISEFSVPHNAAGLELYLKNSAEKDERRNYARTYLVKDIFSDEIAGYFSLRTGLITMQSDLPDGNFDTFPAIELSNFAVNENYRSVHPSVRKVGFLIFRIFILPLAREIAKYVGVNSLYIYALPQDRLIEHYSTFGFSRLSAEDEKFVHHHVKPDYDEGCIFMYQIL